MNESYSVHMIDKPRRSDSDFAVLVIYVLLLFYDTFGKFFFPLVWRCQRTLSLVFITASALN